VGVDLGKRLHWVGEGAGRYLSFDCSHNNREEAYALLEALTAALDQERGGVRVFVDFTEAYQEAALTQRWKDFYTRHNAKVARVACVGVNRTMRLMIASYQFFARLMGQNLDVKLRIFMDDRVALDWLLDRA
jgi:hypothetical protein